MADTTLTIVMTYDVVGASTRRRVAKLLEERMVRVQKSVFEARLSRRAADKLFEQVEVLLEEEDSLRMYVLTMAGFGKCRATGGAPLPEDGGFWLL